MSVGERFDFAILGGGCAGLSLADALLRGALGQRRVAIVEPRTGFRRDRTWCFWDVEPHAFEDSVAHRWSHWKLRRGGVDRVHAVPGLHYCEIPADAFYRTALERIAGDPRVDLLLGTRAAAVHETDEEVCIETDRGLLRAGRVFDGRPPARRPDPQGLLQHFIGLHVRSEHAAFEPGVVTLMDFDVSQAGGIHFFYVLPFARDRALVEATFISPRPLPEEHYLEAIDRYLHERHGVRSYKTDDRERGVIPMSARRPPDPTQRVVPIGTAGGLVRPSTGYAFLAIQRWTRAFASALARHPGAAPPGPRPRLTRSLDAIFLAFLRRHPERAPEIFERLFARVEPASLVRFLSDAATPRDTARVIAAMPTAAFIGEALRSPRSWLTC